MTDNISRMYKLAGVKLEYRYSLKGKEITVDSCNKEFVINFFKKSTSNFKVVKVNKIMNFTAEKQLNLIKFFGRSGNICIVLRDFKGTWLITNYMRNGMGENIDFSQALATFVINVWDLLNEAGKQEIKRILE